MDLFILTSGVTDLEKAAITSASDVTVLDAPDDLAELVLGTTELMTVKFLTAANTYESWSGDASYAVIVSLGLVTSNGLENYAEATLSTAVANGKSGYLALTTTDLIDAIDLAFHENTRAKTVQLVLQVSVTDPSGYRHVYAMLPITVWGRVPVFTPANTPIPSATYLTASEIAALYALRAAGYNAQANSTGNSSVAPASTVAMHTEIITFSGVARTSVVILSTTGRSAGDQIVLRLGLPTTTAIVVEVRNATASGTLLASLTTDGSGDDATLGLVFDGTAWQRLSLSFPS